MKFRFLEAWGFGTALFLSEIYPVLNVNGLSAYHTSAVSSSSLLTALTGMVIGALLYMATFVWLPHTQTWRFTRLTLGALLPLLILLANRYALVFGFTRILARVRHAMPEVFVNPLSVIQCVMLLALWCLLLLVLYRFSHRSYNILLASGRVVLVSIGLMGIFATVDIFRALAVHRHDDDFVAIHERTPEQQIAHPRVVWIILDELSYQQTFGHRAPGLALPNLDALAAQSDVYTNVKPVAFFTDLAVPSLLAGHQVDALHYSFSRGAQFHFVESDTYHAMDPQTTVLGEAQRAGWNVGVVGWWNPYCMLFAGDLQSCRWIYTDWAYGKMRAKYSTVENLHQWVHGLYGQERGVHLLNVRVEENRDLYRWSQNLLADQRMDFIFLHLAVPHAPYVYNRKLGKDTNHLGGSYLDGLALADRTLQGLMQTLQASPRWANTTLVVQGDHSWRTGIWKAESGWTSEDDAISSGGEFDDRPVLLVHHPGQTATNEISEPTPLLGVHNTLTALLHSAPAK